MILITAARYRCTCFLNCTTLLGAKEGAQEENLGNCNDDDKHNFGDRVPKDTAACALGSVEVALKKQFF